MADLTYRTVDIRTAAIHFDLTVGYSEPPEIRGSDDIVPEATGRFVRTRIADKRTILLEGYIVGATAAAWRISTDAAMAVFQLDDAPGDLVIDDAYLGTAATKTISARTLNLVGGEIIAGRFQRWSIELESVSSPPVWG